MTTIDPMLLAMLVSVAMMALVISFRYPFAFATLIIVLNERFFGIVPSKFGDYELVRGLAGPGLLAAAILLQFLFRPGRFRSGLNRGMGSYLPFVIAILANVAISTLWGGQIYNQTLRSIVFQPIVFSYYFLYLYLCFFAPDKQQIARFLGFMVIVALAVSTLMLIDARVFHEARLLKYAVSSERVGLVRILVYITGIIWAYFYSLAVADEEQCPPSRKIMYGASAFFLLFTIIFTLLSRQIMASCFLATAVAALSMKPLKQLVVAWVMALFILVIVADPDFSFEKTALGSLAKITSSEAKTKDSGIGIRFKALEFYYPHFKKTYGLGFGVLGSRREYRNPASQGLIQGYNLNDLSLAGIIFRFGIPGLLLIIVTAWKMFRDTGKIIKSHDPAFRSIARGIRYTVMNFVIIFPLTTFLYYGENAVYFALMFFLVERLRTLVSDEAAGAEA
ncbi:hypothetical protein KI809_17850 [Geobacter pelophilus]|uniref:O-antigen ligase n=1 Tax=Geoanaerobacter pelophilus TaxID=60036 RepID=A0AAW4L5W5_9BACT|nr:hypothetical protein [Geoanaerobacter pelophilus]MBT0666179.1 hypothetical protein [Geoanaerobacter pelophilus]